MSNLADLVATTICFIFKHLFRLAGIVLVVAMLLGWRTVVHAFVTGITAQSALVDRMAKQPAQQPQWILER